MYSEEDIDNAVLDGVLSQDDAEAFRHYVERAQNTSVVDEEHFRFVQGFNDIFVSIASLLFVFCVSLIFVNISPLLSCIAVVIASWCLSEYFTRVRRMALTSIVLVAAFLIAGLSFPFIILIDDASREWFAGIYIGIFVSTMAYLHWKRFQVPITLSCILASLAYGFSASAAANYSQYDYLPGLIAFLCGVSVLAIAMMWDAADRTRTTRKSDVAFWLHLAASPLIVHGSFSYLDVFGTQVTISSAISVLVLYCFLAFVSITLDRRALMVSSLVYVLYVFSTLFNEYGFVENGFAIAGVFIGFGLLVLSAFWLKARSAVIYVLPVQVQNWVPSVKN